MISDIRYVACTQSLVKVQRTKLLDILEMLNCALENFLAHSKNIGEKTFYLNIKIEMNLTILNNCHQKERKISCLAEFGEVKNWSECKRKCSQNLFFEKVKMRFRMLSRDYRKILFKGYPKQ